MYIRQRQTPVNTFLQQCKKSELYIGVRKWMRLGQCSQWMLRCTNGVISFEVWQDGMMPLLKKRLISIL